MAGQGLIEVSGDGATTVFVAPLPYQTSVYIGYVGVHTRLSFSLPAEQAEQLATAISAAAVLAREGVTA